MAATLTVGASVYDIHLADFDPARHLFDVERVNPHYLRSRLAVPPPPDLPWPRLNHLVWPVTGLSHHAYGHLLLPNEDAYTSGTTCTLNLTDGEADTARDVALTILHRRPLVDTRPTMTTAPDSADDGTLFDGWVVTVVDSRYTNREVVKTGDTIARATWGELINALGTNAGFTMPSASTIQAKVHADFGTPDSTAWSPGTLVGEAYAVAADSAATGVGLRIVVGIDGAVYVDDAAASETEYGVWLGVAGRDSLNAGGIAVDRYAAPRTVNCDGTDVTLPSPTTRLGDVASANLPSTASAFQTKWVAAYNDWLNNTAPTCNVGGFVRPPTVGSVQHVEYSVGACETMVVKHPARWPLPLIRLVMAAAAAGSLRTVNSDGSDDVAATTKITASLPDGLEFTAAGTEQELAGLDASLTQKGMVTTTYQSFGGLKQFLSGTDSSVGVEVYQGAGSVPFTQPADPYAAKVAAAATGFNGGGWRMEQHVMPESVLSAPFSPSYQVITSCVSYNLSIPNVAPTGYFTAKVAASGGYPSILEPSFFPVTDAFFVGMIDETGLFSIRHSYGVIRTDPETFLPRGYVGLDADIGSGTTVEVRGGIVTRVTASVPPPSPPPPASPPASPPTSPPPPPPLSPPPPPTSPPVSPPASPPVSPLGPPVDGGDGWLRAGQASSTTQAMSPPVTADRVNTGTVTAKRLILTSPDGTAWTVTVDDTGFMTATVYVP